jgi:hypothetical protein
VYAGDELVLRITQMFRKPESISEKITVSIINAVMPKTLVMQQDTPSPLMILRL